MNNFYYNDFPWYVRAENESQYLYASHKDADWTCSEIDYEFSFDRDKKRLEIRHFTQGALEYFVSKYGKTYEYLYFNNATRIRDFSPLADLPELKSVAIDWCRAEKLWDMKNNIKISNLWLSNAKKITYNLSDINSCKNLENLFIAGDMDSPYPIRTFSPLVDMAHLKRIDLIDVKSEDHDISFLDTLSSLEEFHFDAGMLTTEEIALICAKHPHLKGRSLGAYTTHFTLNDVRICGYRKPGLNLPEQQKQFEKYIAEFNALIDKYRKNNF